MKQSTSFFISIFLLIFFLISNLFAESYQKSLFLWSVDEKDPYKGKCFEVDKETYGKKYTYKVRRQLCRPKETKSTWVQKKNSYKGRCYEVDSKTSGTLYSKRIEESKCYPKSFSFHFFKNEKESGQCVMIDDLTGGDNFAYKVNLKKCKPKELKYRFKISKYGDSGDCLEYDATTNGQKYIKKVAIQKCKPLNVEYKAIQKTKSSTKICYEIDAINGPQSYIRKVFMKNCYNKNIKGEYFWIKDHPKLSNGCYLEKTLDDGTKFHKRENIKYCRPKKTDNIFIKYSPTSGSCFEVDLDTYGKNFKNKLRLNACHPGQNKTISIQLENNCYEVDKKTRGENYIKKINIKKCMDTSTTKTFKWIPNAKNIYRGKCIEINDRYKESLKASLCKPKLTLFKWHNTKTLTGRCYQVHAQYGPSEFSVHADHDKCRPENFTYRYFKKPKEIAGRCYKVDAQTLGNQYYRIVKNKLCQ